MRFLRLWMVRIIFMFLKEFLIHLPESSTEGENFQEAVILYIVPRFKARKMHRTLTSIDGVEYDSLQRIYRFRTNALYYENQHQLSKLSIMMDDLSGTR